MPFENRYVKNMTMKRAGGGQPPMLGEVLFEFQRHGNILRVTAIDPKSGTEVIMVADPRQSKTVIQRLAARKLAYVIAKNQAKAQRS